MNGVTISRSELEAVFQLAVERVTQIDVGPGPRPLDDGALQFVQRLASTMGTPGWTSAQLAIEDGR